MKKFVVTVALMCVLMMISGVAFAAKISIISPNGGEVWHYGETQRIKWVSEGINRVNITIFDDSIFGSGSTNYITPENITVSAVLGYYDWTIKQQQLPHGTGQHFKISVSGADILGNINDYAVDISDNYFSIVPACASATISCQSGQQSIDGKCVSVPVNPVKVGYPDNGAIMGIPEMNAYIGMVPLELKGVARSYIEIQIVSLAPIVQAFLDSQFVDKGWVMTSTEENGVYIFLLAGPRPFGEAGKRWPVLYLNFQAAGPVEVGILGTVDEKLVVTSASFTLYKKGDTNMDGDVSVRDAIFLLEYLISQKTSQPKALTSPQYASADVNWDGVVNIYDAIGILQLVAGIISSFDQLSGMGAPPKTPKSFGAMAKELANKGVDPAVIALLNQLAPPTAIGKIAGTWGGFKK